MPCSAMSCGAEGLILRTRSARPLAAGSARSVLVSTMRSASATCLTDAGCASSVASPAAQSTVAMTDSSRSASAISRSVISACRIGAGSASPVVSITMRSKDASPRARRASRWPAVRTRSPRTLQHRQPPSSSTTSSSLASTRRWSRPTSPNSFTITAVRASAGSRSRCESSVVFPLPRKPVTTLTGRGLGAGLIAAIARR